MIIKVLLVDDHAIMRHALSQSIQQEDDMDVVGQANSGLSAVALTKELHPHIVIMDISMPDINGMDATRQILHDCLGVKVIALSMHSGKQFVREMFEAGASGYLLKDCQYDELMQAIRIVMAGKTYLSPSISETVVDSYIKGSQDQTSSIFAELTKREREVLQLLAEGQTTKQIGQKLHISPKTVEAHRLRVMEKLAIDNIAQLTKYAIQEGLTSPEP